MGPKTFKCIVDHVFPTRKKYYGVDGLMWDWPDYGGLPAKIYKTLSVEAVDAMQYILNERFKNKREFARAYKKKLFQLGELGNYRYYK